MRKFSVLAHPKNPSLTSERDRKGVRIMTNPHIGSSFDDFLDEEGLKNEITTRSIREILAWQGHQKIANLEGGCDSSEDEHQSLREDH
jgi:hypothetical protein